MFEEILSEDFACEVLSYLGLAKKFLKQDSRILRLKESLKDNDSPKIIEAFLDDLFLDLRKGEVFIHTEAVMAILVVTEEKPYFKEVASVFANSSSSELSALRHFSRDLLGDH